MDFHLQNFHELDFHESGRYTGSPKLRKNLKGSDITELVQAKHYTGSRNERVQQFVREYYPTYAAWYDLNGWYQCDVTRHHVTHYEKRVNIEGKSVAQKSGPVKGSHNRPDTLKARRIQSTLDKLRVFCSDLLDQNKRVRRADIQKEFQWSGKTVSDKMKEHVLKRKR